MKNRTIFADQGGFTLLEMMLAVCISGIAMAGIYQTFEYQQRSYLKQEEVVEMQQGIRAGQYYLKKDMRMAGFDPMMMADSVITIATATDMQFEMDIDFDESIDTSSDIAQPEIVRYLLYADWAGGNNLVRVYGNAYEGDSLYQQVVAENVEALEFCYVLDDGSATTDPLDTSDIRSVIVTLLTRSNQTIKNYVNDNTYVPASVNENLTPVWSGNSAVNRPNAEWGPYNDGFRRQFLVTKIRCRNMGLNPFAD
ncbi:MAG: prepilin-type N-terminal cleavage/methylation domain-containing protein [Deltaproteobacteria bacterium]|nr:prepilin-type N-terminal cleavage/methylation domain-containing protein [Deltaproteobacteria bacterium]